jgi:nicotinate-nucleotide pyrophosphorylase
VATFLAKADGTLAGEAVAIQVFAAVDPKLHVSWSKRGRSVGNNPYIMQFDHSSQHEEDWLLMS